MGVRSGLKAATWRLMATATSIFMVFAFTGRLELTVIVEFCDIVMKLVFYFLYKEGMEPCWIRERSSV